MAPFLPSMPPLAHRSDATTCDTTSRALVIVGMTSLAVLVAALVIYMFYPDRWLREAQSENATLKQVRDRLVSTNAFLSKRIDKLQAQLDQVRNSPAAAATHLPSERQIHDNPFAVGDYEYESDDDAADGSTIGNTTATAQVAVVVTPKARKTSVFSAGSSPRALILTPTSSGGDNEGKSSSSPSSSLHPRPGGGRMREFVSSPLRESTEA